MVWTCVVSLPQGSVNTQVRSIVRQSSSFSVMVVSAYVNTNSSDEEQLSEYVGVPSTSGCNDVPHSANPAAGKVSNVGAVASRSCTLWLTVMVLPEQSVA